MGRWWSRPRLWSTISQFFQEASCVYFTFTIMLYIHCAYQCHYWTLKTAASNIHCLVQKKKKKKSHTNILLDCVSFDDSTHPLFHYKLMQCYNTYFHLDLHFFTNILHWWWELDRYIKSSSANPGSSMRLRSGLIGGQSMRENALWTTLWQLEPNESWRCQI